jgi:hypothetical protein
VADQVPLERELAGLPELEAFPTREQRDAALRAVAARNRNPYDRRNWRWSALLGAAAVAAIAVTIGGLTFVNVPGPLAIGIGVVAFIAVNPFLCRTVRRWAARPVLRAELEKIGVTPSSG